MSSSDASSHDGSSSGIAGTATGIVQGNPGAAESKDLPAIPGFEILGELGRGGMGVVYRARETALDRVVALKILPGGFLVGEEQVTRFRREARAAASLDHPGIVKAHHVGVWGPVNYIVQEYIEGTSLDRWLLSRGPLSPREAVELLLPLVRAVAHAHERGIVHRDLKPANVLIDRSGQPKLTDFGLARRANDTRLTQSGAALGTPAYMAPEQAEGIPSAVGERTDVYGLGAILYEALVGTPPLSLHSGEHPAALLLRILRESPLAVRAHRPEIDSQLDALCMRCLEKNPGNRYPSAGALAAALEDYLASGLSSPRRVPGREAASLPADGGAERVLVEVAVAPASPPAPTTGAAEAADFAPSPSPAPPVPLAVRAHSGHHARLAGRRGILALALLFLLVAAGSVAVWKGLPGLGNKPGPRKRPIPEAGPKTWAEADAQSARLAEAGQPFEAARALHEARALPGGKAGAEEAARIEALLAASVEAAAA
ncbi:MAG: serine/threonine protein kinase, partial [Planctomycetes bacterium]|nr:serine/threonine protein kinase [Planctomycetota bacterium]